MKNIKLEVTLQELMLLTSLISDQLFRREFIDPKMPGYKGDPSELAIGKDLVLRLKSIAQRAAGLPLAVPRRGPGQISRNPDGNLNAV